MVYFSTPPDKPVDANTPYCLGCGYPLVNLSEPKCPECGRIFDPQDTMTYGPTQIGRPYCPRCQIELPDGEQYWSGNVVYCVRCGALAKRLPPLNAVSPDH